MYDKKLTIKFYLNRHKPCQGGYKIYMRVIYNREKMEIATEHHSTEESWDKLACRDRGSKQERINRALSELENKVYKAKDKLRWFNKSGQIIKIVKFF